MVNTLSGSVSAYRKENVKPRFIRIDEVMQDFRHLQEVMQTGHRHLFICVK